MSRGEVETVLITGGSSGLGLATAMYLAGKGYSVIATSRSMERLAPLQRHALSSGQAIATVELDINSDAAVEETLPLLIDEHDGIDVLVNNAGYGLWGPVEGLSIDELRTQFETNVYAPLRLMKAVLPGMSARRRGTIINVSSVVGRLATPFNGGYAASKFALEGLSEAMRVELWPLGVRVVVVEPGIFRTRFQESQVIAERAAAPELPYHSYVERYKRRHRTYNRFAGNPAKVARVIHKIVRSRRPRFRYIVGPEARLGIAAARLMPERLFQALLSRATIR